MANNLIQDQKGGNESILYNRYQAPKKITDTLTNTQKRGVLVKDTKKLRDNKTNKVYYR